MPAYLQPLAFVSCGVIQPDLEDEPATIGTAAVLGSQATGLGYKPSSAEHTSSDADLEAEPASTSAAAAGLGFQAMGLGFQPSSADQLGTGAGVEDEPATIGAAAGLGFGGLGFEPAAGEQPSRGPGLEDGPLKTCSGPAGAGLRALTAEHLAGDSDRRTGVRHGAVLLPSASSGAGLPGPSMLARSVANEAGSSVPPAHPAAPAAEPADHMSAWLECHVDAAGAAAFERIAGEPLRTVLRRGLAR